MAWSAWKSRLGKDEPFGISWSKQYVTALGIAFPYNVHVGNKINFDERLAKLKNVLNIWSSRPLTILGRIAIVKNLALAKLVYSCSVLNERGPWERGCIKRSRRICKRGQQQYLLLHLELQTR